MWNYGNIPSSWEIEKIGDYATVITDYVANGSFASLAENVQYKNEEDYAVLIRLVDYNNNFNGNNGNYNNGFDGYYNNNNFNCYYNNFPDFL